MMTDVFCNRVSDTVALLACALADPTMLNYWADVAKPSDVAARPSERFFSFFIFHFSFFVFQFSIFIFRFHGTLSNFKLRSP
jgi:hypothetical protein